MPLEQGARLGPYEVLTLLGAGGMGEVYRGRDTRLDRTVALKVVHSHLAADSGFRDRFEREARVVSSLNHPNICTLHDVGRHDGTDFLVMELLEGETLADRLRRGALPADQVVRIGIEIASALDKAHRSGIVHRDLKPGNVMLTKSGAKLLDFGLAKLQAPGAGVAGMVSALGTEARPLTGAGTVLGTFQYMAPEQLEGKEADARTDIFALGAILYETASGCRAFSGKSQASLAAAILAADPPPLSSIQPLAPPALERLVKVCLAKDPDDRLQTAHDVMQELKWVAEGGSAAGVPAPVVARRRRRERLAWVLAALLPLMASALTFVAISQRRTAPQQPARFQATAPDRATYTGYPFVSPDGRHLAFLATVDGVTSIWVRPIDSLEAHSVKGTEGAAEDYMWSADGASLAFVRNQKLLRLDLAGGPALTVCSTEHMETGDWSGDGTMLLTNVDDGRIYRVPASGGTPEPITIRTKDAAALHKNPIFLPDGRHFLYLVYRLPLEQSALYLASLDSPEGRMLTPAESQAFYAEPGNLFFMKGGILVAQRFDLRSMAVQGEAVPVTEDVSYIAPAYADFSVSVTGTLAFRRTDSVAQLTWFDRAGRTLGTLGEPGLYANPRLSPEGRRVVVEKRERGLSSTAKIWLFDLQRGSSNLVTRENGRFNPVWSPDGRSILFAVGTRGTPGEVRRMALDGSGNEEVLFKSETILRPGDVSPDGRTLALMGLSGPTGSVDILSLSLEAGTEPSRLVPESQHEIQPRYSPDGRWLAYAVSDGARVQAYVQRNPPDDGRWQVSVSGGFQPQWRSDGREIFFLAPDGTLTAVSVEPAPSGLKVGQATALFRASLDTTILAGAGNDYLVGPRGERFVFVSPVKGGLLPPVTVFLNWTPANQR